jgi:hypothetical protein
MNCTSIEQELQLHCVMQCFGQCIVTVIERLSLPLFVKIKVPSSEQGSRPVTFHVHAVIVRHGDTCCLLCHS